MKENDIKEKNESKSNNNTTNNNKQQRYSKQFMISLVSGVGAGLFCTVVCAPLDVVKIRLQVQGSLGIHKYTGGSLSMIRTIYKEEGLKGVFRGVGPAMFTIPLFWGVYWPIYDRLKAYYRENHPDMNTHTSHMCCAVGAGVVSDVMTNPFWVTRTRIQTLALHSEVHVNANISTLGMMRMIYEEEGFLAFYRGLGASFLGLAHVAIQFPLYEYLKQTCRERHDDRQETLVDLLGSSIVAKFIASSITYPHEVLRARLQDGRVVRHRIASPQKRINIVTVTRDIIKKEGFFALWTGLRVNLVRIIPATCTSFVSYEYISRYLQSTLND